MTEKELENIIHKSPWLLNDRFVVSNIVGSNGKKGRQINIGNNNGRFIDLLFKDISDNRPVLIELKKGKLNRDSLSQIVEYRSLVLSLNDELKNQWKNEFGDHYHAPKLMLIGDGIDKDTLLSASLLGIEIKTFNVGSKGLNNDALKKVEIKYKELIKFRKTGNRTLSDRPEWIQAIIERTNEVVNEFDGVTSIDTAHQAPSGSKGYFPQTNPYINLPINYKDYKILGFYEYYEYVQPYDDRFIYCDFRNVLYNNKLSEELLKNIDKRINSLGHKRTKIDDYVVQPILIPRTKLEDETEYRKMLKSLIKTAIEIYHLVNTDEK